MLLEKLLEPGSMAQGIQNKLTLGNLDASRDWGFAGDMNAMYLMMQYEIADDWVIATGETHTVEEFVKLLLNLLV